MSTMTHICFAEGLAFLRQNLDRAAYIKARLFVDGELVGECFNIATLLTDMHEGLRQIDVHSVTAGGGVPIDLPEVDRIEWYVG